MGVDASPLEDAAVIALGDRKMRSALPLFSLMSLLAGCTPDKTEAQADPPPTVTLYGMKLTSFRGTSVVAAGRAAKLTYVRTSTDFVASEVLIRFPSSSGLKSGLVSGGMEVRTPTLLGNQSARQADGKGGVVMRSGDGVVANTESVHFDGISRTATGESKVDAVGPRYALTADRFNLKFQTEVFEFGGNVQTRLGSETGAAP